MSYTNQLINETSPYLLQHAHNPVNWLPFGDEAFSLARRENKPLLISIGYSACHWCHVMEHESFENEEIAGIMNAHFICVKVDREERPDVDHVFMDAVQQIHGNGGWPLNCFALPDGRPFWGGTYFKPEQWTQLLTNITELYQNHCQELEQQAVSIVEGVAGQTTLLQDKMNTVDDAVDFNTVFQKLQNSFDSEKGGIKGAPKFPLPVLLEFLLLYSQLHKDSSALQLVEITLQKMACGGIFDQAGGGFARYSTDSEWKVPHFEKMLYDNAQLISLYSKAFLHTGNTLYKDVLIQTNDFISRELVTSDGAFYSAIDADSEGEEGLYYTWTAEEFDHSLGAYAELAGEYYGVGKEGLWEQQRNILLRIQSDELFAKQHFLSSKELDSLINYCRSQLLKTRSERPRPGLDDKMLVSWNAMMISALVDSYIALGDDKYLLSAIKTAGFILKNLRKPGKGLFHTWKNNKAQINGFLDDYAFTSEAFLKLFSVTTDETWLHETETLVAYAIETLFDSQTGFFWYSESGDSNVFARKIEIYDGVIPSGNSVMAGILQTLGVFLHNYDLIAKSLHMKLAMKSEFLQHPSAYANWARLSLPVAEQQHVIAVVGPDSVPLIQRILGKNLPGVMVFGSSQQSNLPYFEKRYAEDRTLIYICTGTHCMAPVETVDEVVKLLNY